MNTSDKPNPGSAKAIAIGCTCAVMDNNHGRGSGPFWISDDCPVHGSKANTKKEKV